MKVSGVGAIETLTGRDYFKPLTYTSPPRQNFITNLGLFFDRWALFKQNSLGQTMKLLRWAALPAILASLTLSSCSGQVTKAAVTPPSQVAIESPPPQADTFDAGLDKASSASYTAKTAETSEDWDLAVARWQQAVKLMQDVPKGSANYAQAQQNLTGYQRNLTAAQSRTTPKEVASEPVESTSVSSSTASSDSSKDDLFLAAIETVASPEGKAWASDVTSGAKISLAHNACEAFSRGVTFQQVAALAYAQVGNNSTGLRYMGQVIGAGVAVYCPEYRSKLPS